MTDTIAFIGGGNMAASLIGGLLAAGHPAKKLRVAEIDADKVAQLGAEFGVAATTERDVAVRGAQVVVLAVKPQSMAGAIAGLPATAGSTVISIAAGLRIASLRRWLGNPALQIVRCMPNTPALLRAGVSGLYAPPGTTPQARAAAQYVLEAVGAVCWVDSEPLLDAVTAVSGSGPAYVFQLCEMMRDAGIALGLPPDSASQLATQTLAGAARMLEHGEDAATLRAKVTSRGGTTAAALERLEAGGVRGLYNAALEAAARRAAELGDELDRA